MRVINVRAATILKTMEKGETFEKNGSIWIVSGYCDGDHILCVNLATGNTEFVHEDCAVVPVNAEVHKL